MYDGFFVGNLHQVSRDTYGIFINDFYKSDTSYSSKDIHPFLSCTNHKDSASSNIIRGKNSAIVILQKGQPVPSTGMTMQLQIMGYRHSEKMDGNKYTLQLDKITLLYSISCKKYTDKKYHCY